MRILISSLFALLFLSPIMAQKQTMSPELLWQLGRVGLDDVSPSGEKFIYGVSTYDLTENRGLRKLYLYDLKKDQVWPLTADLKSSASGGHFISDEQVAFLHQGQLKMAKLDGSQRQNITQIEGGISGGKAYALPQGGLRVLFHKSFAPSKAGPAQAYEKLTKADFKIYDDLMYRHWDRWDDGMREQVCVADYQDQAVSEFRNLLEGETYASPVPPFGGSESYSLSPDGRYVVYEMKPLTGKNFAEQTNSEIILYDLENKSKKVISAGLEGYDKNPQFSPDGSQIAWLSMATNGYESDVNNLVIYQVASGERKLMLQGALYDKFTFQDFAWINEKQLYVGLPMEGTNQVHRLDLVTDKVLSLQPVSDGPYNYNHFAPSAKGLIVERQDINHATEIYHIDPPKRNGKVGKVEKLTAVNDEIYDNLALSQVEKRLIKATDSADIHTWVIYPPDFDPSKKYPTLLYCQGGPQAQVSQFYSFRWNFQLMAAQGYIVVAPNRRGLPGFGREWNEAISGDWGGQPIRDYLSAIDAMAEEDYVDEERLGAVGASYGGYSVYLLAGVHEGRFKSFISHCGLFDLESWYLSTEEMFFANYDLGGPFWETEHRENYRRFDPKDHLHKWDTPILVIHGGKDFRVPENQGMQAFNAAQLRGVPSRFLYFPQEGHWVLSPQNGLVWHDQFFAWLDQWLQKAP